jgi:hypothetical protein
MFKRWSIHFALILLFALAQIGAVTHGISHVEDFASHSQHDKNSKSEQCTQCISFAQVAGGLQAQSFVFTFVKPEFFVAEFNQQSYISLTHTAYAARAPPYFI